MKNSHLAWIICLLISGFFSTSIKAQESQMVLLEKEYKDLYGIDKLKALNVLGEYYYNKSDRKALKYARQAVVLSENIFIASNSTIDLNNRQSQVQAYLLLGKVQFDKEDYFDSKTNLESVNKFSTEKNNKKLLTSE